MNAISMVPCFNSDSNRAFNIKDLGTLEENDRKKNNLIDSIRDNISAHLRTNYVLVSWIRHSF